MQAVRSRLCLGAQLDTTRLRDEFQKKGRLRITNVLEPETAEAIYSSLAQQTRWNLVFDKDGQHVDMDAQAVARWPLAKRRKLEKIIHESAGKGFQYHYESIPIYDVYHKKMLPGDFLNEIFEFLNSKGFLDFARLVTGDNTIGFADAQATRYGPGHFLTSHDDNVEGKNRRAAYVLSLTRNWNPDWGGALQFFNPERTHIEEAFLPSFNALALFRVPTSHSVSFVTPFARTPRLSITGWLRSGKDPLAPAATARQIS